MTTQEAERPLSPRGVWGPSSPEISFQFTSCFILVLIYFSVKLKSIPKKYAKFLLAVLGHHNILISRG